MLFEEQSVNRRQEFLYTHTVTLRVTEAEYAYILEEAEKEQISVSTVIRCALRARISSKLTVVPPIGKMNWEGV